MATKREIERQLYQQNALMALGFTHDESEALRRISMQLHRWHELECGVDNGGVERDEQTGKTYWYNAMTGRRTPCADRETGARKRLDAIIAARNARCVGQSSWAEISAYIQGDPRGAALYLIRSADVPKGESVDSYYTRGVCVY